SLPGTGIPSLPPFPPLVLVLVLARFSSITGVATCWVLSMGAASGPGAGSAGGAADTSAFSSMSAISAPTATVWSGLTRIFATRPATGDGNSALILSVMISASDSSFSTQSPSLLSQDPTVPSATDSPKRGIFTGVGIYILLCKYVYWFTDIHHLICLGWATWATIKVPSLLSPTH